MRAHATSAGMANGYVSAPAEGPLALHAELLRHDSATQALEHWCHLHGAAAGARVVALRVRSVEVQPSALQRCRLRAAKGEVVRHRRVRLLCGALYLAEADNWYLPHRLTPAMNWLLDWTDTPFGRAVQGLRFRRRLLAADLLGPPAAGSGPGPVLRHRALLVGADGLPLAEVVESYTREAVFLPDGGR